MATTKKETVTTGSKAGAPASKPATSGPRTVIAGPKPKAAAVKSYSNAPLFGKDNYRWMLIGIALVALGLILMAGGKSPDPNVFDPHQVYSVRRITIAPILILAGFVIEIFAIFRKDKPTTQA
jgi:hypothetical protein